MTLLVGIRCSDGVIVAADSAVTFGVRPEVPTISHRARKIDVVGEQFIVAGTGQVGLAQRFVEVIDRQFKAKEYRPCNTAMEIARAMASAAIKDFVETQAPKGSFGALAAFPKNGRCQLMEFAVSDFQPEVKDDKAWFVSMGSGQNLADPNLALVRDLLWRDGAPNLIQGQFAATWVMKHSIQAAPGFISTPIDIAVLDANGKARLLEQAEIQESLQAVAAACDHFRQFFDEKPSGTKLPLPPQ